MGDLAAVLMPFRTSQSLLRQCHRPFVFARPAATSTTSSKRELPLTNSVRKLDASDRDGRVRERLEPGHRCAASLDRAVVLLNEVVEVLVRPHLNVPPTRMLASQQPQRTMARHVSVERYFARHTWECR